MRTCAATTARFAATESAWARPAPSLSGRITTSRPTKYLLYSGCHFDLLGLPSGLGLAAPPGTAGCCDAKGPVQIDGVFLTLDDIYQLVDGG